MATRLPNYQMRDGRTRLGQSYFNPIWADLDSRLDALERIRMDWNRQVAQLRDLGLKRIDEYIRPVIEEVNAILEQAHTDTDGLAAALVDEHITPLVTQVKAILEQVRHDTNGLAQALVDEHIAPILAQAQQLLSDIQSLKQTAREYVDTLAAYPAEHLLGQLRDVDGPGSGLDADTVDGKHSSEFVDVSAGRADNLSLHRYIHLLDYDDGTAGRTGFRSYVRDGVWYLNRDINAPPQMEIELSGARVFHEAFTSLPRYDLSSGSAVSTLDLAKHQVFRITANVDRTLAIANNPGANRAMTTVVNVYGNAGLITWPSAITWSDDEAPELRATRTTVTLMWDGESWTGFVSGGID